MQLLLALGDDGEYLPVPTPCPKQRRISVPDEYPTQVAVQCASSQQFTVEGHSPVTIIRRASDSQTSSLRAYPSTSNVDSLR